VPASAIHPILLLVAGPAGSGKTTLCERLVATRAGVERVLTATTRPKRPGEIEGVHYFFLSEAEFDARLAHGQFLEWAWVHRRFRYGTLRQVVCERLAAGANLVMNVDVQGVRSLRTAAQNDPLLRRALVTVFVAPDSLDELRARLRERGEDPAEIERRMQTAEDELREAGTFDYQITSRTREEDFAAFVEIWEKVRQRAVAPLD
jgi:guanylate kinase